LELHETNSITKKLTGDWDKISREQYAFSELLSNYQLTNKLLDGIFIYYPRIDLIIGDLGCFSSYSYHALDNNLDVSGYEQWIKDITLSKTGFVTLKTGDSLQFCSIKNMMQEGEVVGYIVSRFNKDELLMPSESFSSGGSSRNTFGLMLDHDILFAAPNDQSLENLIGNQIFSNEETEVLTSKNYLLHTRPSQFKGLLYVNAYYVPDNLRPLFFSLMVCILGILGIGIWGLMFSIRVGRENTKPLQIIINRLGDDLLDDLNEFDIINHKIDNLFREQDIQVNKLYSQQGMIGGLFLNMVLNTDFNNEQTILNAAKRYDIVFKNPYYLIGIIKMRDRGKDSLQSQIIGWFDTKKIDVTVSFLNHKYILLFNPEEEISPFSLSSDLQELLAESFWGGSYPATLGRCYDNLLSISFSYREAMIAMNQTRSVTPGLVSCYNEVMEEQLSQNYTLDYERFADALSQRKYKKARKAFEIFFAQCCSIEDTASGLHNLLSPLEDSLIEAAKRENISLESFQDDFFVYSFPRLLNHNIMELLDKMSIDDSELSEVESYTIAKKAKVLIERDYTDSLLGLYRISEELGVSNSYLSTTFKNTYGIGVIKYINKLRIKLAKDLILNTDMNIKKVAIAVGFSSDISFIRVFKKYEKRTPNTLRKQE
jgi:AraC-like DNA-binding protein